MAVLRDLSIRPPARFERCLLVLGAYSSADSFVSGCFIAAACSRLDLKNVL